MATETTSTSARAWSPDQSVFQPSDVIPDALIMQTSSVLGEIEGDAPMVRVAYVDDAEAQFTAEGGVIPEADPGLDEVLVATGKVTQLVRLSREQWEGDDVGATISDSVRRAVTKKANQAYLGQPAPTAPAVSPAAGLLNVSDITEQTIAVTNNLDPLVDLVATLEALESVPSHIIVDPMGWAKLRKIKTETGSAQTLLGAGTTDAVRMLLDLPVLVTPAMPVDTGLVVDKSAVVSAVGLLQVAQSEHVYFNSDSIALRCTWRIGHNVVKPARIGKFAVAASAA